MGFKISQPQVFHNLIRFRDSLLESHDEKRGPISESRSYKVLLSLDTGDMRFAKKIHSLETHFSKKGADELLNNWKEVHLIVKDTPQHQVQFDVVDSSNQKLTSSGMTPLAWTVSQETIKVLNSKGKEIHSLHREMLPEEAVLEDLSSIHPAAPGENIEDLPGWAGSINRIEAEQKLNSQPLGSFLVREADPVTDLSIPLLSSSNDNLSIRPFVLTLVEKTGKVVEHLILHIEEKGWILYKDDPQLESYTFYPTPQALFHSLKPMASRPIMPGS